MKIEKLFDIAKTIPEKSGCYLFKCDSGNGKSVVLYVGKAKNLRKRVISYFQKSNRDRKTELMMEQVTLLKDKWLQPM